MREVTDRQLWAWILGKAAAERLAGIPLSRIERLGEPELLELAGGRPRARAARAVAELARRFGAGPPPIGELFLNGHDVARVYRPRLGHEEREYCYVLALDAQHRLLREALVGVGGSSRVSVDPRDVFTPVLRERADGAIVIHNHPAGDPAPSAEDRAVAARLQRAAEILGVQLLDFVIVASAGYVSFEERGFLGQRKRGSRPARRKPS